MKKTLLLFSVLAAATAMAQDVTLGTLLDEMVDRDCLTRFPSYTLRMYSSYDRKSVAKDKPEWFANGDNSQFIRVEEDRGRREFVMLDAQGPGAIVRWWQTGDNSNGTTLRVYIDGKDEPAFSGTIQEFISGTKLCGAPLSAYTASGRNLYLPIPYAKRCKVTYESPHVWAKEHREPCYYNIEARTYDSNVKVESFTMDILNRERAKIERVNALVSEPLDWLAAQAPASARGILDGTILPGKAITKKLKGPAAVRMLSMALAPANAPASQQGWREALRSTIIEMTFDGKRTVWAPAGDFFGTAYRFSPYKTRYTEVAADGRMFAAWVMPYKKDFTITIRNLGNEPVTLSQSTLMAAPYAWDNASMYFGAGWTELNRIRTRKDSAFRENDFYDVNYVTLTGEGVLVGTGVALFNTCSDWWGEGDEKIYVDGEDFPSFFGTGSEDYFSYGWGNPSFFQNPFITQPYGNGNGKHDITINTRYRGLDAIPFTSSIQFDMEMWHWADTIINYAMTTTWYMKPGGTANRGEETALAQMPVVTKRSDIYEVKPISEGRIEAETLDHTATGGRITAQTRDIWSGELQAMWIEAKPGSDIAFTFFMKEAGKRRVILNLTRASDYGIVDLGVNGTWTTRAFDGFLERGVEVHPVDLGTVNLKQGANTINAKIVGSNAKMPTVRHLFGLDYIEVKIP